MSTRAQIAVQGGEAFVYKHCDGYPRGVIPELEECVTLFKKERGHDPTYFLAQVVRYFAVYEYLDYFKGYGGDALTAADATFFDVGWGIDCRVHADIDYLYYLTKNDRILVFDADGAGALLEDTDATPAGVDAWVAANEDVAVQVVTPR